jgi:hypothetical protein
MSEPVDVEITKDATGEFMVAQAEGITDEGAEFVDSYMSAEMHVVDSGRIVLPESAMPAFIEAAKGAGLRVEGWA